MCVFRENDTSTELVASQTAYIPASKLKPVAHLRTKHLVYVVPDNHILLAGATNRGSFPLNGTYFLVNEVFADHESRIHLINIPRSWIWRLVRRTAYFGTSTTAIFKGIETPEIGECFSKGL
ncbi:Protein ROS1 [Prunus yedoensis var. nudiflora]|uniref:Protein ROS1 n=1 Tax=Prunus yedoensis var. nudiflora TaxID=2094558 RepID=A0A314Z6N8_PRUYE|nr:Protein ROS1 [Prunus yedoensis var. nudiflora]